MSSETAPRGFAATEKTPRITYHQQSRSSGPLSHLTGWDEPHHPGPPCDETMSLLFVFRVPALCNRRHVFLESNLKPVPSGSVPLSFVSAHDRSGRPVTRPSSQAAPDASNFWGTLPSAGGSRRPGPRQRTEEEGSEVLLFRFSSRRTWQVCPSEEAPLQRR